MATPKSFPAITGGCVCNTVRYRLLTSPLHCYACHCPDCQKRTGSAFSMFLTIELYYIKIISSVPPAHIMTEKKAGTIARHAECPTCHVHLWSESVHGGALCDVRIGTLDFPSLMEPDAHIFVESKLDWISLPEGAKTFQKGGALKESWPQSSLKRLEICERRTEEVKKRRIAALREQNKTSKSREEGSTEADGEGDKTPTALEFGEEDDEAFEKRFKETEKALQERLEKLTLKLDEEEVTKKMEQTTIESENADQR
ncbi:aldehyde-activating protein [Stemphylium lycopersici]|nr:aldehyde-activating protein [Stemphylium lycopersici]